MLWIMEKPAAATEAAPGFARVAVASNFTATAQDLAEAFAAETGHEVVLSFGATGQLYAQITQGAPFDLFLAADTARPHRLVEDGLARKEHIMLYAHGRLALISADEKPLGPTTLAEGGFRTLAVANPRTAPYGAAAEQAIAALGLTDALAPKLVRGANIGQTYQFVASGAAELGLVAWAQVSKDPESDYWLVPEALHAPIEQGAVLLDRGAENPAARAFFEFLQTDAARAVIAQSGYGAPPAGAEGAQ